ncbi:MAG TPA: CdaR family protein [Bacteroidia bacterium]|nr:CdaR family protein [Bacteroidia bacterium]
MKYIPIFVVMVFRAYSQSRTNKGRVITFFICLFVSAFFWSLMTLSKEYTIVERFPVAYIHIPTDKIISNNLPAYVDMEIKAKGFGLLLNKFRKHQETIELDIRDAKLLGRKNVYYLLASERMDKINIQFQKETHVLKINPDTIFINFNKKVSKVVPVKSNLSLQFTKLYNLTDSVTIKPEYVTVSAEAEVVDKIDFVETQALTLRDVSASETVKLALVKQDEYKHVEFSQPAVNAIVHVTKFTEASLEIPVEVENLPQGYSFKTFPDKVAVKFNVAFESYEKINAASFRAVVDYAKIDKQSNKVKIHLVKIPAGVRNVKLATERVEYIISK